MVSSTQQLGLSEPVAIETGDPTPTLPTFDQVSEGLEALSRATRSLKNTRKLLDEPVPARVGRAVEDLASCDLGRVTRVAEDLAAWVEHERETRGNRLRADLREAGEEHGFRAAVLSRDPLELFLAPITVRIDVDRDRADLYFGRVRLSSCRADGWLIAGARAGVLHDLEGDGWQPEAFLARLREAWTRAGVDGWAELVDVLPEVALLGQPPAFRKDPTSGRFVPYPRVQFAYDLWRLRRDRCLAADGWRLTLGTATGGSTRDKSRVVWLEDGRGGGQYHLSLRFVKEVHHG